MHLDLLCESNKSVAARKKRILEHRAPAVEAVLKHAHRTASVEKFAFQHPGPALFKGQPSAGGGYDSPGKRVGIDQDRLMRPLRLKQREGAGLPALTILPRRSQPSMAARETRLRPWRIGLAH